MATPSYKLDSCCSLACSWWELAGRGAAGGGTVTNDAPNDIRSSARLAGVFLKLGGAIWDRLACSATKLES
jgi:hypothetical protein